MTIEVKVPSVGESVAEVEVSDWLKKEGDTVQRDEILAMLETEKATVEVFSPADGQLARILKPKGARANVGDVLAHLEPAPAGATMRMQFAGDWITASWCGSATIAKGASAWRVLIGAWVIRWTSASSARSRTSTSKLKSRSVRIWLTPISFNLNGRARFVSAKEMRNKKRTIRNEKWREKSTSNTRQTRLRAVVRRSFLISHFSFLVFHSAPRARFTTPATSDDAESRTVV